MTSPQQIAANRQNAQLSTGAATPEGKQRSSKNATRHGLTGQTIVISPEEKELYETHCIQYLERYSPANPEETALVQQSADLDWSLHQIFVQQSNVISLINALTVKLMNEGELEATVAAIAPLHKSLGTLSIYEERKRRAAAKVREQLAAILEARKAALAAAAKLYKAYNAQGKVWAAAEFGFVYSAAEIEAYIRRTEAVLPAAMGANSM